LALAAVFFELLHALSARAMDAATTTAPVSLRFTPPSPQIGIDEFRKVLA
jgi:hypothetical protein